MRMSEYKVNSKHGIVYEQIKMKTNEPIRSSIILDKILKNDMI